MFELKENIALKNYNTFGIDVKSRFFIECSAVSEILEFIEMYKKQDSPLMILGGGSNILFTKDFEGYVLRPSIKGIEVIEKTADHVILRVGAGEDWDSFVAYCVDHKWGGIENLSLIPGNVGTCPIQNIGAYGVEVKDVISEVEVIDIESVKMYRYKNKECNFGYRDSIFKSRLKGKQIITHVSFRLSKRPYFKLEYGNLSEELAKYDQVNLENIRKAVVSIRESKLPKPEVIGNAGSFFKNPVVDRFKADKLKEQFADLPLFNQSNEKTKIPAGWLIEKAGWKGRKVGNTGVHEKQALVLVNYGNATGTEVINLATEIQKSVKAKFDIDLEMEVNVV